MLGALAEGGMLGGSDIGTRVALLTGSQSTAARRQALLDAASGDAGIVIGTHALIQDNVQFFDLALVVVDVQHRFGVEQRDALREKGKQPPHVLVMTATPIPRTVAMTVFGDMETSTLRELPRGRSPIATHVVPGDAPRWIERTWERVAEEVRAGRQAYVVCPRIGGDEKAADDEPFLPPEVDEDGNPVDAPRELASVYAAADLFVFPSHADTFGLVMVEAMATGTPVAAYPVDGPLEVLGKPRADGRGSLGSAMHADLQQACFAAMAIPRHEARARALDFSWEHAAQLFTGFLVPARHSVPSTALVTELSSGR